MAAVPRSLPEAFASYDSLEGVPIIPAGEAHASAARLISVGVRRVAPGLSIAVLIALASSWLADHYGAPVMLFALLIGMAVNFVGQDARCRPGIDFSARNILRIGVALLGARITVSQVVALGGPVLAVAAAGVLLTMVSGWLFARAFRQKTDLGVLTGGSVAICGASAALAISSVLPQSPERERDTILTVVGVTALSTLAMIVYPVIAAGLHLGDLKTGVFLGATIHDVAQVVGAGYGVSKETGDTATIVKLFRVALLLPAVLAVSLIFGTRKSSIEVGKRPPLLPGFLVGFAALVAINSLGIVPAAVTQGAGDASRWFLVTAIAAVGAKTSLGDVARVGWRPVAMIVLETVVMLGWVLAMLAFL